MSREIGLDRMPRCGFFFFFFFLGDPEWDHLCFTDLRLHLELLNEYEYS